MSEWFFDQSCLSLQNFTVLDCFIDKGLTRLFEILGYFHITRIFKNPINMHNYISNLKLNRTTDIQI